MSGTVSCGSTDVQMRPWRGRGLIAVLALAAALALPAGTLAQTVTRNVAGQDDDAQELNNVVTTTDLTVRVFSTAAATSRYNSGFRFTNMTVPRGARIDSATLTLQVNSVFADDLYATLYGNLVANANDFAGEGDIDTRAFTTANVALSRPNMGAGAEAVDVKTVVQEIVDQGTWASSNAMAMLLVAAAAPVGTADFEAWDGGISTASLSVTYTPALQLAQHGSGQIADQFGAASSQASVPLFRFRFVNPNAAAVTVDQIVFPLSAVAGIAAADLANLRINNGADVVTGGVPAITAPNGTITFDTNWAVPGSSTVSYTLFGDASSLAGGDTVTIALGTANVTLLSAATRGTAPTSVTHLAEFVTLGQHAGLQVRDQFDAATSKNDVQLFRFQLVNASASPVTVDQVTFALADVAGLVSGDLTDLRLSDGTAWVSTGGAASITAPNGTITLTGDFTIPASATVNYTLAGDVANLGAGDVLRISLAATDVLLLPAGVATGTTQWVRHVFGTLGPLLAYSDNAVKELRYSRYATGAWDAPGLTGAAATDILYRKVARTRVDQQQQAVVFFDNGYNVGQGTWGRKNVWVSLWDGASWDDTGGAPYGDALNTTTAQWGAIDSDTQGFDAAYESLSGRLLLVSGLPHPGDFYYSLWDGSFWKYYAIQDSTTFPGFDQVFRWVRLVPVPGTEQDRFLGMGWMPAGNTGGIAWAIWNGDTNTWGNTASYTTAGGNGRRGTPSRWRWCAAGRTPATS